MHHLPKIIFPETDSRILSAVTILTEKNICHPVLIGDAPSLDIPADAEKYTLIEPDMFSPSPLWQGAQMVADGKGDGIIAGAQYSTADVLRAYLKNIGTEENVQRVSSCFIMEKNEQKYIFADCAVNIDPTAQTIAETVFLCDRFASLIDMQPKTALLSFSTKGSAQHSSTDKMKEALSLIYARHPNIIADGELQADAALVQSVAAKKAPDSTVAGTANILVFPDLNSGNIGYKLVERLGDFTATGPVLLGFAKPAHDLSRGCSTEDIVRMAEIAVLQSESNTEVVENIVEE